MRAVIVAAGDVGRGDERWLDAADLVVAADGGAATLAAMGRRPNRLVGDLDSVPASLVAELEAAGVAIDRHPADKDASDTELAVEAALAAGASTIILLGAFGGPRLDHELANLLLLADPALAGREVRAVRGPATARVVRGGESLAVGGGQGDLVTLLPLGGDADGVTAHGLRWPLDRATLRAGRSRGLSNEVTAADASVSLERGTLLVIEHAREGALEP